MIVVDSPSRVLNHRDRSDEIRIREEEKMKKLTAILVCMIFAGVMASVLYAAGPKSYQVTGPVLQVTDDLIVVQKGNDKWEIARDAATKITGELKVGSTVTIQYKMTAVSVDVKGEKPAAKSKSKS
jgi:RNase P/RNase MRP subunit p29